MEKQTNLKGGRRHFHVILFILFMMSITASSCQTYTSDSLANNQSLTIESINDSTIVDNDSTKVIEYRTPEDIEIQKLYNLLPKVNTISNQTERKSLATAVYTYGLQYSIDPILLLAIARVESNFTKDIVGYGNCVGYFQINLRVHKVSKNFKNDTNEQAKKACQIYTYYHKIHRGNLEKSLNGYNGNSSSLNKYAKKVLKFYNQFKQK